MPYMTHCTRCGHSSVIRTYDSVMCLLCGYELTDPKVNEAEDAFLRDLIRNATAKGSNKRGPKKRKDRLSA